MAKANVGVAVVLPVRDPRVEAITDVQVAVKDMITGDATEQPDNALQAKTPSPQVVVNAKPALVVRGT